MGDSCETEHLYSNQSQLDIITSYSSFNYNWDISVCHVK